MHKIEVNIPTPFEKKEWTSESDAAGLDCYGQRPKGCCITIQGKILAQMFRARRVKEAELDAKSWERGLKFIIN